MIPPAPIRPIFMKQKCQVGVETLPAKSAKLLLTCLIARWYPSQEPLLSARFTAVKSQLTALRSQTCLPPRQRKRTVNKKAELNHGSNKANSPQDRRRKGTPQAACHKGRPQICSYRWRGQEAPSLPPGNRRSTRDPPLSKVDGPPYS